MQEAYSFSGGPSVAEGCVACEAFGEDLPCGLEFVTDESQAEQPGAHGVSGVLVLLGFGACAPHRLRHLGKGEAELDVAFQLAGVEAVLLAVLRGIELEERNSMGSFVKVAW